MTSSLLFVLQFRVVFALYLDGRGLILSEKYVEQRFWFEESYFSRNFFSRGLNNNLRAFFFLFQRNEILLRNTLTLFECQIIFRITDIAAVWARNIPFGFHLTKKSFSQQISRVNSFYSLAFSVGCVGAFFFSFKFWLSMWSVPTAWKWW